METDTDQTLVIFRKYKNGEVIALFPLIPSDYNGYFCLSYVHIGQHSSCDPFIVEDTKLASEDEYLPLANELKSIGYNLKIGKKIPRNAMAVRKATLAQWVMRQQNDN